MNFQKEGFQKEELLAGLAQVLPKNVWQYVVQIPRLASLGRKFVLQGGTQYNLAAVKAQVDYIKQRVPGRRGLRAPAHRRGRRDRRRDGDPARHRAHRHARRFIGVPGRIALEYSTKNDEETVCHFCANECKRTFIDARRPDGSTARYISGFSCEKGTVESKDAMLALVAERKKIAAAHPNLVEYEARRAFQHFYEPAPHARRRARRSRTYGSKRGLFGASSARPSRARSSARAPTPGSAASSCGSACRAC